MNISIERKSAAAMAWERLAAGGGRVANGVGDVNSE